MIDEIRLTINTKIKPLLKKHNGDIELIKEEDGIIEVKLLGACSGCPSARFTMEDLVEKELLEIRGVKKVIMSDPISSEILNFAKQLLKSKG
jgi:Fe-S cluster biogenesis protein NfuA